MQPHCNRSRGCCPRRLASAATPSARARRIRPSPSPSAPRYTRQSTTRKPKPSVLGLYEFTQSWTIKRYGVPLLGWWTVRTIGFSTAPRPSPRSSGLIPLVSLSHGPPILPLCCARGRPPSCGLGRQRRSTSRRTRAARRPLARGTQRRNVALLPLPRLRDKGAIVGVPREYGRRVGGRRRPLMACITRVRPTNAIQPANDADRQLDDSLLIARAIVADIGQLPNGLPPTSSARPATIATRYATPNLSSSQLRPSPCYRGPTSQRGAIRSRRAHDRPSTNAPSAS